MNSDIYDTKSDTKPVEISSLRMVCRGLTMPGMKIVDGVPEPVKSVYVTGDLIHMKSMDRSSFEFYLGSFIKTDNYQFDEHFKNLTEVQSSSVEVSFDMENWISLDKLKSMIK